MKTKTKTPFRKLTAAQKRVAIAKDVLKQISARRIKIQRGVFVLSRLDNETAVYNQASVRKLKSCTACAVGAAIVCGMRLFNKVERSLIDRPNALEEWFTPSQIQEIEWAFECGNGYFSQRDRSHPAVLFGERYSGPTERARAIFKNITTHNGEFVP